MPNLATLLKSEILRLARKEVRTELESFKKASARYRGEIAELKRRVAQLEKQQAQAGRKAPKSPEVPEGGEGPARLRFSAKRLAAQRRKLGLSAGDMGRLIGVSGQTIYHWEAEKARPRRSQLEAIAALRGVGKREAQARLAALARETPEG